MSGDASFWRWDDPLSRVTQVLARGGVLAVPTESSYGLGVDPLSVAGVEAVYRLKGRDVGKPLPVVVSDFDQLAALGVLTDHPAFATLAALWPAALSLVLPLRRPIPAAAGAQSLAVRIPDHARLRELLRGLRYGLTATSANLSGGAPLLVPEEAARLLAAGDGLVIDGCRLPGGPPSTVVALEHAHVLLLRAGRFPVDRLRELVPDLVVEPAATAAGEPWGRGGPAA